MAAVIPPSFKEDNRVIEHKANRWSLIGTAFDYRVRMGISLSNKTDFTPHIADTAFLGKSGLGAGWFDCGSEFIGEFATYMSMDMDGVDWSSIANNPGNSPAFTAWEIREYMPEVATKWNKHMNKDGHYIDFRQTAMRQIQDGEDNIDLSKAALKFANWDPYYRAGCYNPDWDKIEQDDVEEIEALYKVWQKNFVLDNGDIQMNPNFGESSLLVGGADSDLIVGTTLIDWKVINNPRTGLKKNMAQLLGYAALAHLEGQTIEHVTLYFGRHGQTVTVKIEDLTDIPLATIAASIKKLSKRSE